MVQRVVLEAVDELAASVPTGLFLSAVIGPEEMGRSAVSDNGNEPNEIIEAPVRDAFDVEIKCDVGVRDRWAVQDVNFLVAEGDGLEGVVMIRPPAKTSNRALLIRPITRPVMIRRLPDTPRVASLPLVKAPIARQKAFTANNPP